MHPTYLFIRGVIRIGLIKIKMKKLAKRLAEYADIWQIELSKWTNDLLYEFIIKIVEDIRNKNDN